MTWSKSLPVEIQQLFASLGQHPEIKIAEWVAWKFGNKNARRRALYAIQRYMRTPEYTAMLAEMNRRSKRWRTENYAKYRRQKDSITNEKLQARAKRFIGLLCERCGNPIHDNARHSGPIPKYCSAKCNHLEAARAWWHRRGAKPKLKTFGQRRRMGLL